MRLPIDLLFVPPWLTLIQPRNPVDRCAQDPVYPPSKLTVRMVTSDMGSSVSGTIDPLAHETRVVGARRARKERAREEHYAAVASWLADRMDTRAERRAAKEERRIMMARRQEAMAAFACDSPTWCDGTANDCHHCPYGREE